MRQGSAVVLLACLACASGERDPFAGAGGNGTGGAGSGASGGSGGEGVGVGGGAAGEPCDGLDNDADGTVDEGCICRPGDTQDCYGGPPALAGIGICAKAAQACELGSELAAWGPCEGWVPPQTEACDPAAKDEDCSGAANEGCACDDGSTLPCGSDVGACVAGMQTCTGGVWSECEGATGPTLEACAGAVDDDCDGATDCMDSECAQSPLCTDCGNGVCEGNETAATCPCDCSACATDQECAQPTPYCCIPCGCNGPAMKCVNQGNCCG